MTIKLAVGIPALFLLSACTGLSERLDGSIDETGSKVSTLVKDIGRTAPGVVMKSAPVVAREKGIWLGKNIVKLGQPALRFQVGFGSHVEANLMLGRSS